MFTFFMSNKKVNAGCDDSRTICKYLHMLIVHSVRRSVCAKHQTV